MTEPDEDLQNIIYLIYDNLGLDEILVASSPVECGCKHNFQILREETLKKFAIVFCTKCAKKVIMNDETILKESAQDVRKT